jgi:multidrug resistance efflux pump
MNRTLQSTLAILLVMGGGAALWKLVRALEAPPPPSPPRELGPVPVSLIEVVPRELVIELDAFGNLEARRVVTLTPEVSGRIVAVLERWRPGETVEEGELLVRVDPELYELDVRAADAALLEARAGLEAGEVEERRARRALESAGETREVTVREHERLVGLGEFTSESLRDQALRARLDAELAEDAALSALEAARAALETARARVAGATVTRDRAAEMLERTRILAPFRGRLRGQAPGLGTVASQGLVLGELVDPTSLVLTARVPERDLLRLVPGQRARLVFPSTPETEDGPVFGARVAAVDAASDPTTRRGLVEIELDRALGSGPGTANGAEGGEETLTLPAGLFTHATIEVERLSAALWIDRRHFRWEGAEAVAYVLARSTDGREGSVAERRPLTFVRESGEGFVVRDGLAAGDRLIVHPLDRMDEGVTVRPLETAPANGGDSR